MSSDFITGFSIGLNLWCAAMFLVIKSQDTRRLERVSRACGVPLEGVRRFTDMPVEKIREAIGRNRNGGAR